MGVPKGVSRLILLCFLLSTACSHAFITHIKFDHKKDPEPPTIGPPDPNQKFDGLAIRKNFGTPQGHRPEARGRASISMIKTPNSLKSENDLMTRRCSSPTGR